MSVELENVVWVQTSKSGKDFPVAGGAPVLEKLVILSSPRSDSAQTLGSFQLEGRRLTLRFTEPYNQILNKLQDKGHARPPVKTEGRFAAFIDRLRH